MPTFSTTLFLFFALFGLLLSQTASAQSIKQIQEYCQSMGGSGMSDEDSKTFIDECIAEQSSYLEQDTSAEPYEDNSSYEDRSYQEPSYEESSYEDNSYQDSGYESAYPEPQYEQEDYGQEQNCYTKVDEHIQKLLDTDPNSAFDYDQLVDQCLKGKI